IAAVNSGIYANANLSLTNAITLSNSAIFRAATGTTLSLNGAISGDGTLRKTDLGTVSLNNPSNNYTGAATLAAGTLAVGDNAALPAGALVSVVPAGTTMTLAMGTFTPTIAGLVMQSPTAAQTLTLSGTLT